MKKRTLFVATLLLGVGIGFATSHSSFLIRAAVAISEGGKTTDEKVIRMGDRIIYISKIEKKSATSGGL